VEIFEQILIAFRKKNYVYDNDYDYDYDFYYANDD